MPTIPNGDLFQLVRVLKRVIKVHFELSIICSGTTDTVKSHLPIEVYRS